MKSMRPVGVRAAFACLALATYAQAASSDTDALIQKVERHYNKALTLTVDFAEQYSVQGHPRIPETGTLTLRKQGKMRWDYARPAGKVFVSDGKMMYLYTSADNKVEEIPLKDTEDMRAPLAFLLGHLDLKKEFTNFATRPGDGQTWLSATAKNDKTPYEKIQMLINPEGEITMLTVLGRDQSTLAFSLTNEKVNPTVRDSLFAFKIPPGAEVVNALDYTGEGR
jgi:outer membrane lipoprotein carrier protein